MKKKKKGADGAPRPADAAVRDDAHGEEVRLHLAAGCGRRMPVPFSYGKGIGLPRQYESCLE